MDYDVCQEHPNSQILHCLWDGFNHLKVHNLKSHHKASKHKMQAGQGKIKINVKFQILI